MTARVQNLGLANITGALAAYSSVPKYLQWGTGSGASASATAVTTTSTTESRVSGTAAQVTTTQTNDTFQVTGTITAAGSRSITEVALFDAAGTGSPPTGGNMCIYGDFSVRSLLSGDSIAFTIKTVFA